MRSSGPSICFDPPLHAMRDPPVAVDHHEIGHARERSVRGLDLVAVVEEDREEVEPVAAQLAANRVGAAGQLEADQERPLVLGQLGERRLQILEGLVAMRAGVEKEQQQHRAAARRGEIESLLLVEDGGRERGRDRAIAGNRIVLSRKAERLADLRFDRRRPRPDRAPGTARSPRRDSPPRRRRAARRAPRGRGAARCGASHRRSPGKSMPCSRRIALGLRAIRPDRDADDVEVVVAAELGDARDRIADRDRDLCPPDRRSRRPGACRCASRCRGAGRRASNPRMRAAASRARCGLSSALRWVRRRSFPVNPRRRRRARARLRGVRKRAPAPVTLRAAG